MGRIRQIRDVIFTRRNEDLDRSLAYQEIQTRAIMQATLIAGKNEKALKSVQNWTLPRPGGTDKKEQPTKVMSSAQATRMFGSTNPKFSPEQIAARAAELAGAGE